MKRRVTESLIFFIDVSQSPSKIKKKKKNSHLLLCKYSNLNLYWQENFPGNFLVNPLMNTPLTDGAFLVINVIFAYK